MKSVIMLPVVSVLLFTEKSFSHSDDHFKIDIQECSVKQLDTLMLDKSTVKQILDKNPELKQQLKKIIE